MDRQTSCRILSLDGGGIRGLLTAIVLEELERKLQVHNPTALLKDYFDIIAGTSTGSLIACAISQGLTASQIKNLYLNNAAQIFPQYKLIINSIINRIRLGFSQPIFDGKGLNEVLRKEFNINFGTLQKPTLIISYDTYNRQSVVFKNTKIEHRDIPVWEICRASSAAPIAFPAFVMQNPEFIEDWRSNGYEIPDGGIPLIDGGVVANNPALCAIAERISWNDKLPNNPKFADLIPQQVDTKNIIVASFGTGKYVKKIGLTEAKEWGIIEWVSPFKGIPILDVLSDGAGDSVCYIAQQIIENNFYRFQPEMAEEISSFSANDKNIAAIADLAVKFIQQENFQTKLNQLVKELNLLPSANLA